VFTEFGADALWTQELGEEMISVRGIMPDAAVEGAMDRLTTLVSRDGNSRIILTDVQALLPRPEEESEPEKAEEPEEPRFGPNRIGREELYTQVNRNGRLSLVFSILVALSSVVAGV